MIIKILHIVSSLSIGSGVMSTIMNFYRKIDKSKVQFDFVYFYDCIEQETYKEEIISNVQYKNPEELNNIYERIKSEAEPVSEKDRGFITNDVPLDAFIDKSNKSKIKNFIKKLFKK